MLFTYTISIQLLTHPKIGNILFFLVNYPRIPVDLCMSLSCIGKLVFVTSLVVGFWRFLPVYTPNSNFLLAAAFDSALEILLTFWLICICTGFGVPAVCTSNK